VLANDLLKGAKAVADETGGMISQRQVYHLVERGMLPVIRKGRTMYFRRSELEAAFRAEV